MGMRFAFVLCPTVLIDCLIVLALEPHLHDNEGRQDLCAAISKAVEVLAPVMVSKTSRVTGMPPRKAERNLAAGLLM
jgi:hypothetical protein